MKRWLCLLTLGLACSPDRPEDIKIREECTVDPIKFREELKTCLIDCTKAGNPMSDEEGEDLVRQCQYSCSEIYCTLQLWYWDGDGKWSCSARAPEPYRTACKRAGFKP